jgi:DNA-binding GntR family transcriptional regulator
MRSSLEALHAELTARRVAAGEVAPAELRRLRELVVAAEKATDAGDTHAAAIANRTFHQAIDRLADSPVSAAAADALWDRIMVTTERSLVSLQRRDAVNREHRRIFAALEAGDAAGAADLAGRHVRTTLEAATQPLGSQTSITG